MSTKSVLFFLSLLLSFSLAHGTVLDDFITLPDTSFDWEVHSHVEGEKSNIYLLKLTSQRWQSEQELSSIVWTHWLTIAIPHKLCTETAVLNIGNGVFSDGPPVITSGCLADTFAGELHAIVGDVALVPNQCLSFFDESDPRYTQSGRSEDALVAYTWDKFFKTTDSSWPLQLPMTKATVRAMDAIDAFMVNRLSKTPNGYLLVGASKRGWTAWLTAAVDARVKGIIPLVFDALKFRSCLANHYKAYGGWSFMLQDYIAMGIMDKTETLEFAALMKIQDPYEFKNRFTMPKYLINAAGDEFFLPDSSQLYFHDLPGKKYLRYIPNAGHYLTGTDCLSSAFTFAQAVVHDYRLPEITWHKDEENVLRIQEDIPSLQVILWKAVNPEARDFRLSTIGDSWEPEYLFPNEDSREYTVKLHVPEKGWAAYFVELVFASRAVIFPLKFTTDVYVLPETFPYQFPPNEE